MCFLCFPGQNKNLYVVLMFMYLVQSGILEEVHLEFMVPGHSYLPCDRGFGVLENACKSHEIISCPDEYMKIFKKVKNTIVTKLRQDEIYDFKSLKKQITPRTANPPLYFHKARRIILRKEHPWAYHMITDGEYCAVDLKKARKKGKGKLSDNPVPKKYPHGKALKIDAKKVEDIEHFNDYLPRNGRAWIAKLVSGQQSARNRPQTEEEQTPDCNLADDDQLLEYTSVLRIRKCPGDDVMTEVSAQALAESDPEVLAQKLPESDHDDPQGK